MKFLMIVLLMVTFLFGCAKGFKEGDPLTGEELALAQEAAKLTGKVNEFTEDVPSPINDQWSQFAENVKLFDNSCQRLSCNSLEARNHFNHLRYYAVQLDKIITKEAHPAIYAEWTEIRKDYVDAIGRELGYRIE